MPDFLTKLVLCKFNLGVNTWDNITLENNDKNLCLVLLKERGGTHGNARYQNTFRPVERLQMMIVGLIEPSHVKET